MLLAWDHLWITGKGFRRLFSYIVFRPYGHLVTIHGWKLNTIVYNRWWGLMTGREGAVCK